MNQKVFINIWPVDGLSVPKRVATIGSNELKRSSCQTKHIFYFILI